MISAGDRASTQKRHLHDEHVAFLVYILVFQENMIQRSRV